MCDVPGRALLRDCSACSYDAPVGTDVLSLLHKDCHTSRLSMHPFGQARTYISMCRCNDQANWFGVCCWYPDVLLRVLLVVQQLLQQNKHCSKRDIYYMYPSIFVGLC